MEKKIILVGLLLGVIAIVLGAFGAHALKKTLTAAQLASFETGVKYQMYHALLLVFVASTSFFNTNEKTIAFYLTLFGILFFSGSIYLLTTASITGIKTKILGPITPIGGMLLISAWGYLIFRLLAKK